ncbi:hypothetical protein [Aurantiacibacter gangjinensis]|uniref:Uncharacterized protein n=1 Tax=Aurantiacibacter gangjinensis TaxID=502682 RepID=A0A0G9MKT4_9SPHN|nr:hypothetical protein [Aurantiacibacter gangjinensis]APE27217.1 hypothetical protein BMF35_a0388 [Aurantiacibacter gangjinensis]KLE31341.1 hypothetical protein AAW01_06950 [Aurantiacibacter gangjinensis]
MGQYEPEDSRVVTHSKKPDAAGLTATGAREDEARRKAAQGDGDVALPDAIHTTPARGEKDEDARNPSYNGAMREREEKIRKD